jgi:hypothetical protein
MKNRKMTPGMRTGLGALACALLLAACPVDGGDPPPSSGPDTDPYEGKLLILQTYGTGPDDDGAISHSFVELYNKSDEALDLSGITLQYADGIEGGTALNTAWRVIPLSGSVPAGHSFLILGKKANASGRLQLEADSGDINDDNFVLDNHAYKAALLRMGSAVSAANPFSPKVSGYIDLIGAVNATDEGDSIDAYETAPLTGIKKHGSARRKSLDDTGNNAQDFEYIDYRTSGTTAAEMAAYKPRNIENGQWDPAAAGNEPPPAENQTLMILQAYGHDNKNDPAITHCFVELYNNTGAAIDLSSYSLQAAEVADEISWTVINLTGSIPAHGSYLIRGGIADDISDSRLDLSTVTPDVSDSFILSNDEFKVALMSNQTPLTVHNPFDTDESGTSAAGYVDMVGAGGTDKVTGYETAPKDGISKQKAIRRKYLADTDNNENDFKVYDYRTSGMTDEILAKCRPRTAADGSWTPEFPD